MNEHMVNYDDKPFTEEQFFKLLELVEEYFEEGADE